MKHSNTTRIALLALALGGCCQIVNAKCGGVDYSWGADGLAKAHDFVITMLLYVVYLCYAIAGVVTVVGAISVYIAMNNEEQDVKKKIMMVVGACIFLIAATDTEYVAYSVFKGLQKPLEFLGIQGGYIFWAAATAGGAIVSFIIAYWASLQV